MLVSSVHCEKPNIGEHRDQWVGIAIKGQHAGESLVADGAAQEEIGLALHEFPALFTVPRQLHYIRANVKLFQ
jgi:hypothetical protein